MHTRVITAKDSSRRPLAGLLWPGTRNVEREPRFISARNEEIPTGSLRNQLPNSAPRYIHYLFLQKCQERSKMTIPRRWSRVRESRSPNRFLLREPFEKSFEHRLPCSYYTPLCRWIRVSWTQVDSFMAEQMCDACTGWREKRERPDTRMISIRIICIKCCLNRRWRIVLFIDFLTLMSFYGRKCLFSF